ncbi:aldehyde dehydrogenase family protein [Pseudomonas aeruginosa]|nr:aldehyde dehydrogenase family protein [Pseudomonas aeruginosa]
MIAALPAPAQGTPRRTRRTAGPETGKNLADAKGDVWRGIEVVEHAANVASLMMGETVENVAREIDTASWIQPLGVCAGITSFNFPAMIRCGCSR